MQLEIEINKEGLLQVKNASSQSGSTYVLNVSMGIRKPVVGDGSWSSIQEILKETNSLDVPKRTHEDILQDLHTFRKTQ
jgi:hypothetical protein